jgi:hypothetical protein
VFILLAAYRTHWTNRFTIIPKAAGQRDLIALYAGALGENAIERYAMFLTSLELTADIDERRLALNRAKEHGLDVSRVAIATAESTIDKAFEVRVLCVIDEEKVS